MSGFLSLIFSPRRAIVRLLLISIGVLLVLWEWQSDFFSPSNPKILLVLDNSLSMTVQDISANNNTFQSRLETAKNFSHTISGHFQYETALAEFSAFPTLLSPLSSDKNLQKNVINSISPVVYGGGSDIFRSLSRLLDMYRSTQNLHIIVLTDAEFFEKNTENFAKPQNISFHIVGVGTEKWWSMLMGYDPAGKPIYREFEGKIATSVVNPSSLSEIAKFFSGDLYRIESESDMADVSREILSHVSAKSAWTAYIQLLGIFFLCAGVLLDIYIPRVKKYEK